MSDKQIRDIPELRWVEKVSRLMDNKFRLPGTNFKFGLDPIIGLVPFLGDAAGFGISFVLVMTMWRYEASGKVKILMLLNILLDLTIGSIPIIGAVFDFFYKSNQRNYNLLKEHFEEGRHQGSGKGIIALLIVLLLSIVSLVIYLFIRLWEWVF